MIAAGSVLADALTAWQARAGRHHLPWQLNRTPYRVWVSEIMLQQTQVAAAVPYYERFLKRFPEIASLAAAEQDEVLHLWSGLGYYARARNLQRTAQRICSEHGGEFPREFAAIAALPGIGRSTAGAILALSRNERFAILDGNVRRVLSRYFAVDGAPNERATQQRLWELAEGQTPDKQVSEYTQAIMDLGAMVCVRRRPLCSQCPLAAGCIARRSGRQHELPASRRAMARATRRVFMVVALERAGSVLLERRPERGVWGGLWCLPQFDTSTAAAAFIRHNLNAGELAPQQLEVLEHAFTHFNLAITPLLVRCPRRERRLEEDTSLWYNIRQPARVGLPAPITSLLTRLAADSLFDAPRPEI